MDRLNQFIRRQSHSVLIRYYYLNYRHQPLCCYLPSRNVNTTKSSAKQRDDSFASNRNISSRIRNIGIVAHIDAGKTTTTERMLYYSGLTAQMGEVHDGDTVMDWMDQERERGITITSASAAINWNRHRINLIDTPGHVDFTFEVERSLSVLDGALVVLDASAGVQAQTIKVWQQANRYHLPRLIYLNKMDKLGASVPKCLDSIRRRLSSEPVQLQIPLFGRENRQFIGLIDVVSGLCLVWPEDKNLSEEGKLYMAEHLLSSEGSSFEAFLDDSTRASYTEELLKARENLIGQLCDLNTNLAEQVLQVDQLASITSSSLNRAIRETCLDLQAIPILCGSSYRNIGVQPLLDAVVRYLPSPTENPRAVEVQEASSTTGTSSFCALAFKITTDKRLGPLTYLRLYSGTLAAGGQSVFNLNRDLMEKITRVYRPFADHFADLSKTEPNATEPSIVTVGDIVAVSGLSSTITGDTLVTLDSNKSNFESSQPQAVFAGIEVPEPVYYCSLESPSLSKLKQLEIALSQLQREDPSFKVVWSDNDKDRGAASTNQIVIKGMGELHIEIVKDRIKREYGIEVHTGPLQISYQESITSSAVETVDLAKSIGGVSNQVRITLEIKPCTHKQDHQQQLRLKDLQIKVVNTKENNLAGQLRPWHPKWIHSGVFKALEYGPLFGFPVVGVEVLLHEFVTTRRTTQPFVTNAAHQCALEALRQCAPILLEPLMRLEIATPEQYIGPILSDLSARRCEFGDSNSVPEQVGFRQVVAFVPLAELGNYSTVLRTISSGMASFDMELCSYRPMDETQTNRAIRSISGVDY